MDQVTGTVLMIRPAQFRMNEQTQVNNFYQSNPAGLEAKDQHQRASQEFEAFASLLLANGLNVLIVNDTLFPEKPDSLFPNNWVSFHGKSQVVLYPMFAQNRRLERRPEVLEEIGRKLGVEFQIKFDLSSFEGEGEFLEGTGSLVLDRTSKLAYAAVSPRTDHYLVEKWCLLMHYKPVLFHANQTIGNERKSIYHTNVMMSVCEDIVFICLKAIDDLEERARIVKAIEGSGKELFELSESQIQNFGGNILALRNNEGRRCLVMSDRAWNSFSITQQQYLEKKFVIIHAPLDTIETYGGGGARCLLAEVFM